MAKPPASRSQKSHRKNKNANFIYGKFSKLTKRKDPFGFVISPDKDEVEKWTGARQEENDEVVKNSEKEDASISPFYRINAEIFDNFLAIYDTIPVIKQVSSSFPRIYIDQNIKGFFREKGEAVNIDENFETYKLDEALYSNLTDSLNRLNSVFSVNSQLDRFFIIGLIAAYDQFIHNLAKAVIEKDRI